MEQIYSSAIEWTKKALAIGTILIAGCAISQLSNCSYYDGTIEPIVQHITIGVEKTIDSIVAKPIIEEKYAANQVN